MLLSYKILLLQFLLHLVLVVKNCRQLYLFLLLRNSYFLGVSHADDTAYVMKTNLDTLSTEEDREMSRIMVDMFMSFIETRYFEFFK